MVPRHIINYLKTVSYFVSFSLVTNNCKIPESYNLKHLFLTPVTATGGLPWPCSSSVSHVFSFQDPDLKEQPLFGHAIIISKRKGQGVVDACNIS